MLNNQHLSAIGTTPGELFLGRPYWRMFPTNPFPTAGAPTVRTWILEQVRIAEVARNLLAKHRDKAVQKRWWFSNSKNTKYQVGDLVLVHHNRFPKWKRKKLDSPWWGPYRVTEVVPGAVLVFVSPKLGGRIKVSTAQFVKKYPLCEEQFDNLWEEVADQQASAEDEAALIEPSETPVNTDNVNSQILKVESILSHRYRHGWRFLTKYLDIPVSEATWETPDASVSATGDIHPCFEPYCLLHNIQSALSQAKQRAAVSAS